jgi:hypothetical protein
MTAWKFQLYNDKDKMMMEEFAIQKIPGAFFGVPAQPGRQKTGLCGVPLAHLRWARSIPRAAHGERSQPKVAAPLQSLARLPLQTKNRFELRITDDDGGAL